MRYEHALTSAEFDNPYLLNVNLDETIEIDNNKLTAEYIWSLNEQERLGLIGKIKQYYKTFPKESLTEDYIDSQFEKLKRANPNEVLNSNGEIKNSATLCLDVTRYYNRDKFYKVRGENVMSLEEVFQENLEQVLKNRMGWYTSTEDGTERPYVFNITDKMIRQGIRSSGLGFNVSQFKPLVAKYLYSKYAKEKVLDYSAGWAARALGALSLGLEYYGIDPSTADEVNEVIRKFGKGFCVKNGSEVEESYNNIPEVDCALSCPPYFRLEQYSEEESQSIVKYSEYTAWLEYYWKPTVQNCVRKLKKDGYFILVMIEKHKEHDILNDMKNVVLGEGLCFVEEISYQTSRNHLSGKKKTQINTKNTEKVVVFRKENVNEN